MRFDELVIKIQGEELRLRFHPELTVLSGLGVVERQSLADSILGALTGGSETTALRYVDGRGRAATLVSQGGTIAARYDDDGTPTPTPIGTIASTSAALRALLLVRANDLGVADPAPRDDEPADLREARATLAELTEELDAVLREQRAQAGLRADLRDLDSELATARDGEARREYAQVLARLERVRSEAAAVQSGAAGIETDRHLLATSTEARELAQRWRAATTRVAELAAEFGARDRLNPAELAAATDTPLEPPTGLDAAVAAVDVARTDRDALDHRLQELAVATLPAPSDPLVAELGLLDQDQLWGTAERLTAALDEMDRLQVAHGGLGLDDAGAGPAVLEEIETAHTAHEDAARSAENTRLVGVAAGAFGVAVAAAGLMSSAALIGVGLVIALGSSIALLVIPKQRVARAARAEQEALASTGATSYLGFHIRRVDASVDPRVREQVALAMVDQRRATAAWEELVGPGVDARHASALEVEVRAYNEALRNLGGAADEIEQLRRELADRAEPTLAAATDELRALCEPFGVGKDELNDGGGLGDVIAGRIDVGRTARLQAELESAEAEERAAADRLGELLLQLGFGDGELDARVGALEWAVSQAAEREESRATARPVSTIEAEQRELEASARRLRRPEWDTVTAADAATPDIAELEAKRAELAAQLTDTMSDHDVERLADRQAAIERRVATLEARYGANEANGDPGFVADIQQNLLARLSTASEAGPQRDPVPMILDEAFLRVPADRKWDLLDLLLRLAERHQVIYLSDDAFVAAWARQQAADGKVILLEPDPEPAS